MKKFLCLLICVLMCVSLLPAAALAEDGPQHILTLSLASPKAYRVPDAEVKLSFQLTNYTDTPAAVSDIGLGYNLYKPNQDDPEHPFVLSGAIDKQVEFDNDIDTAEPSGTITGTVTFKIDADMCTMEKLELHMQMAGWYDSSHTTLWRTNYAELEVPLVYPTVTFAPNGGTCGTASLQTGADGKLESFPDAARELCTFNCWTDENGQYVSEDHVFKEDTTLYAAWWLNEVSFAMTLPAAGQTVADFGADKVSLTAPALTCGDTNDWWWRSLENVCWFEQGEPGYLSFDNALPGTTVFEENKTYTLCFHDVALDRLKARLYWNSDGVTADLNGTIDSLEGCFVDMAQNATNFYFNVTVPHAHSYGTEWKKDSKQHWHECSCGDKADLANHTIEWIVDSPASPGVAGSRHQECKVCHARSAAQVIPAENILITAGSGTVYTRSSKANVTLTSNGPAAHFIGVLCDGKVVPTGNYTFRAGSTIVTFSSTYLDSLTNGTHKFIFVYSFDNGQVQSNEGTIIVQAANGVPGTGDSFPAALLIALFTLSGTALTYTVIKRKHN